MIHKKHLNDDYSEYKDVLKSTNFASKGLYKENSPDININKIFKNRIINTSYHLVGNGVEDMKVAKLDKYESTKNMNFDST